MDKLTTERLEEMRDHYLGMVNKDVGNALTMLLAYERAAKNPIAWVATDSEGFPEYNGHNEFSAGCGAGTPLYAAPVLPKQPVKPVMFIDGDISSDDAEKLAAVIREFNEEERPLAKMARIIRDNPHPTNECDMPRAQPVIPEGLIKAINRLLDNDGSRGCFDALEQHRAKTELERLLAAAQQNEPQNIPENIPAQPVSEPYKFPQGWMKGQFAYQDLFNAIGAAVVSKHPSIEISVKAFEDSMLAAAPAQDGKSASTELPNHFNLSTNSPEIPDGWKLVPIEPTAAMFHAFNDCDYGRKSMRERYIQMIEAAPAQESE